MPQPSVLAQLADLFSAASSISINPTSQTQLPILTILHAIRLTLQYHHIIHPIRTSWLHGSFAISTQIIAGNLVTALLLQQIPNFMVSSTVLPIYIGVYLSFHFLSHALCCFNIMEQTRGYRIIDLFTIPIDSILKINGIVGGCIDAMLTHRDPGIRHNSVLAGCVAGGSVGSVGFLTTLLWNPQASRSLDAVREGSQGIAFEIWGPWAASLIYLLSTGSSSVFNWFVSFVITSLVSGGSGWNGSSGWTRGKTGWRMGMGMGGEWWLRPDEARALITCLHIGVSYLRAFGTWRARVPAALAGGSPGVGVGIGGGYRIQRKETEVKKILGAAEARKWERKVQ